MFRAYSHALAAAETNSVGQRNWRSFSITHTQTGYGTDIDAQRISLAGFPINMKHVRFNRNLH